MLIKFCILAIISSYSIRLLVSAAMAGDGGYSTPTVQLTRSMAQLDRVSGLCKDIRNSNYETYSIQIRSYIKRLYDGKTPYWVLSNVKSRVEDSAYCKWLVVESLIHYQVAYRDYVDVNKPRIKPPLLTYAMSQHGSSSSEARTLGVARPLGKY